MRYKHHSRDAEGEDHDSDGRAPHGRFLIQPHADLHVSIEAERPGVSCCRKPERSVGWRQSAARRCSAQRVSYPLAIVPEKTPSLLCPERLIGGLGQGDPPEIRILWRARLVLIHDVAKAQPPIQVRKANGAPGPWMPEGARVGA